MAVAEEVDPSMPAAVERVAVGVLSEAVVAQLGVVIVELLELAELVKSLALQVRALEERER